MKGLLRIPSVVARDVVAEGGYRCSGCGARWSYEAVRYVALCPECASGLVRVDEPDVAPSVHGRRRAR